MSRGEGFVGSVLPTARCGLVAGVRMGRGVAAQSYVFRGSAAEVLRRACVARGPAVAPMVVGRGLRAAPTCGGFPPPLPPPLFGIFLL